MGQILPLKQFKMNNGEVAPEFYDDVSHPKYAASLRTCKNWLPITPGPGTKRPGTKYIAPTRDGANSKSRLWKSFYSDGNTFILEFSAGFLRIYKNGAYTNHEIATPYTEAMLPYLKFTQVGNTITICYGGQVSGVAGLAPRDLTMTLNTSDGWPWTIAPTALKIPAVITFPNLPHANPAIDPWHVGSIYSKGDRVYVAGAGGNTEWISIADNNIGNSPPNPPVLNAAQTGIQGTLFWMPATDDTANPASKRTYSQTVVVQGPDGIVYESGATIIGTYSASISAERPLPIGYDTAQIPIGWTILYYNLYASESGVFGWLKSFTPATAFNYNSVYVFVVMDDGRSPDYTKQPPQGLDPFLINGADSYPSVSGYLDQRRVFAASALLPHLLHYSKVGDLYNWDSQNSPGSDKDAFDVLLASEVLEQVRGMAAMKRGIILTSQGEWAISGLNGGPVARNSVNPVRQSKWGSSWLDPIIIGNGLLFNTAKSDMVRDLFPLYGTYVDHWDGQDLTFVARHLFEMHTLTAWAFQSVPYPVVWSVRDDGALLSLTYQHAPPSFGQQLADGICAWAPHYTGVGPDVVEDVVSVPEPPEDAAYLIVKRTFGGQPFRYIERMANPTPQASPYVAGVKDVRYDWHLDCAIQFDGHNATATKATINSIANPGSTNAADYVKTDATHPTQVTITCAGAFAAADADPDYGSQIILDPENTLGLGVVKLKIVGYTSANAVTAEILNACSAAVLAVWASGAGTGSTAWGLAKGVYTAAHLNGCPLDSNDGNGSRGVMCLADGDAALPAVWANGTAKLSTPALVVLIGIAYNSDMEPLDAYHPSEEIRNRFKTVQRIGLGLTWTRDMWVGPNFTTLDQWAQRQVADGFGVIQPQTGYFEIPIREKNGAEVEDNKTGRVAIRHFKPLPATINMILREMDIGGT